MSPKSSGPGAAVEALGMTDTPLLKFESHWMMQYQWSITTIQFYNGDAKAAAAYLKDRLTEVARLNPWIGGKMVKDPKRHGKLLAMRYHPSESPPIDEMFGLNTELQIHADMLYAELAAAVAASKACVPNGNGLLKSRGSVCKLTVVSPAEENNGFAVIFSMSHTVADGHTYYAILDMLSSAAQISAMNVERNEKFQESIPSTIGEKEYKFMMSPGLAMMGHYMGVMAKAKKVQPLCFFIDKDKLAAAKKSANAETGAAPYVSTNDIIISGFGRAVNANMLTMAINFRGRMDGLTAKQAGNYHSGLIWGPEDCSSPNNIRIALNGSPPLSRAKLPTGCCITGNWTAMTTNWSSMSSGNLDIPGCTQTLHLPYLNTKEMMEDSCIIFKAKPGEVAVMLFLQNATVEDIKAELPLGEPVSSKMFGC